jgi:hypothetical protein
MPLPDTRGFLELMAGHLRSALGYDEPEILRYSNRQFGPIGADAGHAKIWDKVTITKTGKLFLCYLELAIRLIHKNYHTQKCHVEPES